MQPSQWDIYMVIWQALGSDILYRKRSVTSKYGTTFFFFFLVIEKKKKKKRKDKGHYYYMHKVESLPACSGPHFSQTTHKTSLYL